ncbi:Vacuolar protease A, partial [Entomortierella chlamydospora]
HGGTARVDAFPVSRTSTESTNPLSSPSTVSSGAVLIPLKRLITKRLDSAQLPSNAIQKRGVPTTSTALVTQVGAVGYAGHILMGTPPQRLAVLFDTGSDLVLVTSDRCQGSECPELTHFSCSTSTTCVDLGGESVGKVGNESASTENVGGKANSQVANKSVSRHAHTNPKSNRNNESPTVAPHLQLTPTASSISSKSDEDQMRESGSETLSSTSKTKENAMDSHVIHPTKRLERPEGETKIKDNDRLLEGVHSDVNPTSTSDDIIKSPSSQPPPPTPSTNFYNQSYEDGSWGAGTFVQDRIQIDTTPASEVYNPSPSPQTIDLQRTATITFLNVVQDSLDLVQGYNGQISGLLGLTRASPTGHKTFLQELVEQGSLPQPVVSMNLETEGASFFFGGINQSQYTGELVYSPVTDPINWQISLQGLGTRVKDAASTFSTLSLGLKKGTGVGIGAGDGFKMMPHMENLQGAALVLDSGTSFILIPSAASKVIHTELSGTWDPLHQAWFLPCTGPDLVWWISLYHAVVQPYESLVYPLEDGQCQSLIFENGNADFWILGDNWLRGLYVVYDMDGDGRIGIAGAVNPEANEFTSGSGANAPRARIMTFRNPNTGLRLRSILAGNVGSRLVATIVWTALVNWLFIAFL